MRPRSLGEAPHTAFIHGPVEKRSLFHKALADQATLLRNDVDTVIVAGLMGHAMWDTMHSHVQFSAADRPKPIWQPLIADE